MFIGSWGKVSSILLSVLPDIGKRCRSADMSRGSVMHVNCVVLESSNEARQPGNAVQPGTESRKMTAGKKKGSSKRLLRTEFHSALCRGIAPPICAGVRFTDQGQGALPTARRNKRVCSCQKKSENNKYRLVVSVFWQEFGPRQPFGVRFAVGVIAFLQSALTPNGKVRWGQPRPQEP